MLGQNLWLGAKGITLEKDYASFFPQKFFTCKW
jgi:hypothetical protein